MAFIQTPHPKICLSYFLIVQASVRVEDKGLLNVQFIDRARQQYLWRLRIAAGKWKISDVFVSTLRFDDTDVARRQTAFLSSAVRFEFNVYLQGDLVNYLN